MAEALDFESMLEDALEEHTPTPFPEPTILTTYPLTTFTHTRVQPPAALYFAREDDLRVEIISSVASLVVVTRGRFLRNDGTLIPFDIQTRPTSDRVATVSQQHFGEGFLLNVATSILTGNPQYGAVYASVRIARGSQDDSFFLNQLIADYVTRTYSPGWPTANIFPVVGNRGNLRVIVGTDPAAGSEISETVPTNARWRVMSFAAQLTTSADVGVRTARIVINATGSGELIINDIPGQSASTTVRYDCTSGFVNAVAPTGAHQCHWPQDLYLAEGGVISTSTNGLFAADNWGSPLIAVEEWLAA